MGNWDSWEREGEKNSPSLSLTVLPQSEPFSEFLRWWPSSPWGQNKPWLPFLTPPYPFGVPIHFFLTESYLGGVLFFSQLPTYSDLCQLYEHVGYLHVPLIAVQDAFLPPRPWYLGHYLPLNWVYFWGDQVFFQPSPLPPRILWEASPVSHRTYLWKEVAPQIPTLFPTQLSGTYQYFQGP